MRATSALLIALVLGCGGAAEIPDAPDAFVATGLTLVIGVDRAKTFEVKPDGSVVSSESGRTALKFVGRDLKLPDESKTIVSLDGDALSAGGTAVGKLDGDKVLLGDLVISIRNDGEVDLTRGGSEKKMRMHFEGAVAGHRRPALMLVAFVFALYAAANPHAALDRFVD